MTLFVIFPDHTFLIANSEIDDKELQNVTNFIKCQGGRIVGQGCQEIADMAIVPFNTSCKYKAKRMVTCLYIVRMQRSQIDCEFYKRCCSFQDACVESNCKLDVEPIYEPVTIPKGIKPLQNCSVAMSTYCGFERQYYQKLSIELGAK